MKRILLFILLLSLGNNIIANTQQKSYYQAVMRFYKPANGNWGKGVEVSLSVYINKNYVKIGEQIYEFATMGNKQIAPDGDIAILYLATHNSKTLEIQINYSPETGNATKIYIVYWDNSMYGYILR